MKNYFQKTLSLFLCAVMLFTAFPLGASAATAYPTIYIKGQGTYITDNRSVNGTQYYPPVIPDGYIAEQGKQLISPLADGIMFNQWEEYNAGLYDAFAPFIEGMAMDNNGCAKGNSGCALRSDSVAQSIHPGSSFKVCHFYYDWRLDPTEIVDDLHNYIVKVKKQYKAPKINIIVRCLAAEILLAYFDKYGAEDINDCVLVSLGFDGFDSIGAIFAGKVRIDADAADRFASLYLSTEDYAGDPTFEMLISLITLLNYSLTLEITADVLQKVYKGIKDDAFKRILRDSVASMPSFWAYVGDEYYEDAKSYIFDGAEEEYAGLIAKIDNYHYTILNRWDEILTEAENDGARMYNICKYGFQNLPVLGKEKEMTDLLISTSKSSLGAVCAPVDGTLSEKYISDRDAKYISPDKQIDASSCRYPDHTWFVKNMSHRNFPNSIDDLLAAVVQFNGYTTVNDLEAYPQFIMASDDGQSLFPATAENSDLQSRVKTNFFKAIIDFFKKLIAFFKTLTNK